jgi:hypothetical protein
MVLGILCIMIEILYKGSYNIKKVNLLVSKAEIWSKFEGNLSEGFCVYRLLKCRDMLRYIILFVKNRISIIRCKLSNLIFGPTIKLGTYEKERLLYPIIILNGKLLVELSHRKFMRIEVFFSEFLFYGEKAKIFEKRLMEILEGKDFPLETPLVPLNVLAKETYLCENQIPHDNWYKPTNLSSDFTLALYKMWKVFLNLVICYYFCNYFFETGFFEPILIKDNEIFNKHMTLDLTPFFIYKEQAESVADYLEEKIFEDAEGLNNKWAKLLILGLRSN